MGNHQTELTAALQPSGASPGPDPWKERGRLLFARPAMFVAGAPSLGALPEPRSPEFAFAGRSNAGKSSLINSLLGRRNLARASVAPGRTRAVNFFALGDDATLVDLPGYGYARAAKTERAGWRRLIFDYLRGRLALRRVFLLLDSRRGVMEQDDVAMDILDQAAVSYMVVLTKADQLRAGAAEHVREALLTRISRRVAAYPEIIVTSARSGTGLDQLREHAARSIYSEDDFPDAAPLP